MSLDRDGQETDPLLLNSEVRLYDGKEIDETVIEEVFFKLN